VVFALISSRLVLIASIISATHSDSATIARCKATPEPSYPITVGANRVYVEPSTVDWTNNRLYVAGTPTYLWKRQTDGAFLAERNSIFALVVDRSGKAFVIPPPLHAGLAVDPRIVAFGGRLAAVFAQVDPSTLFNKKTLPVVQGYWFGIWDGKRWSTLEQIPLGRDRVWPLFASRLIYARDVFSVAVPVTLSEGGRVAAVFSRRKGKWLRNDLNIEFASHVALDTVPSGNLVLATVGEDYRRGISSNQILVDTLFTEKTRWDEWRRIERESFQKVKQVELGWLGGSLVASWVETGPSPGGKSAKAIFEVSNAESAARLELSNNATQIVPIRGYEEPVWITLGPPEGGATTITVVGLRKNSLISDDFTSPYQSVVAGVSTGEDIMLVGPTASTRPEEPIVTLRALTIRLKCSTNG